MRRVLPLLLIVTLLLSACGGQAAPGAVSTPTAGSATPAGTSVPGEASAVAEGSTTPTSGGVRPGWITGKATDAQGEPLTNVTVVIRGTTGAGANTYFETEVDETGRYAQPVPDGVYEITAYVSAFYKERTYGLWLHPVDNINTPSQPSADGLVKDFVWLLSGPTPAAKKAPSSPYSYYGGIIHVGDEPEFMMFYRNGVLSDARKYPAGSKVRLELTPDGTLLDGSKGEVLTYDLDPGELGTSTVPDVPLGDYVATASLVDAKGRTTPLQVVTVLPGRNIGDPITPADSAPVQFLPSGMGSFGLSLVSLYILPR